MNAKKCDRCGAEFRAKTFADPVYIETADAGGSLIHRRELCPDCMKEFNEWLKGEQDEKSKV